MADPHCARSGQHCENRPRPVPIFPPGEPDHDPGSNRRLSICIDRSAAGRSLAATSCRKAAKYWPQAKKVAEEVHLLDHLRAVVAAARKVAIRIFFVPHRRWQPGDYEGFRHPTHTQLRTAKRQGFAKGTRSGTFHDDFQMQPGDILIKEHWNSSGFANTDLDYQLKQFAIERIVVIGMIANTCSSARAASAPSSATTSPWCAMRPRPTARKPCMQPMNSMGRASPTRS